MLEAPVPFSCRATRVQNAQWVAVFGELDLLSAPELEAALGRAITDGRSVVLDPRGLSFCDLSARRVLQTIDRLAAETGQCLSVLRGSLVLDRLVALLPDGAWPEFVDPPQDAPRPLLPTASTVDALLLTPAA